MAEKNTSDLEYLRDCGLDPDSLRQLLISFHADLSRRHGRDRRRTARRREDLGLLDWAGRYLPAHFSRKPSAMHVWFARRLDYMRHHRGTKLNVLGPRGGAKSTIGTLAGPLRAAVEGAEPYIWIVSDTKHQAVAHLENIRSELISNRLLAEAYPHASGRGPVWRGGRIELRGGVVIEAFGTGQRIRGRRHREYRPSLIVCDDLQNDSHILSATQRERGRVWFHGTLLKAGDQNTNVVNLATALHREALAMEICEKPGWTSRVFKSIQRWPAEMSLWQQWEDIYTDLSATNYRAKAREFYRQNRAAMDEGASVLWPQAEDLYALMCIRAQSGRTAFEREKQNSPINPDYCEWPESYFDERIWFDDWPKHLRVKTLALDPSKGADARRGDYSALVALGIDHKGTLYVEADLARRATPLIVAEGVEFYRRFQPDAFGVEANQFQELLADSFEAEFRRQGLMAARPWLLNNRVNKLVRIRRLGPYLSSRRIRFKNDSPSTRLLVEQLKEFPIGDHDDGPDALEMAVRLAARMLAPKRDDGLGRRLVVG
ncbi:MAG: hypothetical protein U9N87_08235 [Planctomycetota bacterium]|nr:hypothetical protein [Planctomycetota bacterium]